MGTMRVDNQYYSAAFWDAYERMKIPSNDPIKNNQYNIRMMTPFMLQCLTCGCFIPAAKKFNSRQEKTGEKYLDTTIWRWYIKCPECAEEMTFKTDPRNADYVPEFNCKRTFTPWGTGAERRAEEEEEEGADQQQDAVLASELRLEEAKKEMDDLDALDELRSIQARHSKIDIDKVLETVHKKRSREEEDGKEEVVEEEELEKFLEEQVKRLPEEEDQEDEDLEGGLAPVLPKEEEEAATVIVVKKRKKRKKKKKEKKKKNPVGLVSYASDDE